MEVTAHAAESQAQPGVRLLARWADWSLQSYAYEGCLFLLQMLGGNVLAELSIDDPIRSMNVLILLCLGFYVFSVSLESVLLATWGTTPGKALLGARVRRADGRPLSFREALRRTVFMWVHGMALGLLPVSVVFHLKAHRDLRRRGHVRWDAMARHQVLQGKIRPLLVGVAIVSLSGHWVFYLVAT